MATDKTFTVCGVSTSTDGTKVRFANDAMRVKVLTKNGHTDITLIELPQAMTKLDAVAFIADLQEFASESAQQAISEYSGRHTPKAARVAVPKVEVKPARAKKVVTKSAAVVADTAEAVDEDAPF